MNYDKTSWVNGTTQPKSKHFNNRESQLELQKKATNHNMEISKELNSEAEITPVEYTTKEWVKHVSIGNAESLNNQEDGLYNTTEMIKENISTISDLGVTLPTISSYSKVNWIDNNTKANQVNLLSLENKLDSNVDDIDLNSITLARLLLDSEKSGGTPSEFNKFYLESGESFSSSTASIKTTKAYASIVDDQKVNVDEMLSGVITDFEVGEEVTIQNATNKVSNVIKTIGSNYLIFKNAFAFNMNNANIYKNNIIEESGEYKLDTIDYTVSVEADGEISSGFIPNQVSPSQSMVIDSNGNVYYLIRDVANDLVKLLDSNFDLIGSVSDDYRDNILTIDDNDNIVMFAHNYSTDKFVYFTLSNGNFSSENVIATNEVKYITAKYKNGKYYVAYLEYVSTISVLRWQIDTLSNLGTFSSYTIDSYASKLQIAVNDSNNLNALIPANGEVYLLENINTTPIKTSLSTNAAYQSLYYKDGNHVVYRADNDIRYYKLIENGITTRTIDVNSATMLWLDLGVVNNKPRIVSEGTSETLKYTTINDNNTLTSETIYTPTGSFRYQTAGIISADSQEEAGTIFTYYDTSNTPAVYKTMVQCNLSNEVKFQPTEADVRIDLNNSQDFNNISLNIESAVKPTIEFSNDRENFEELNNKTVNAIDIDYLESEQSNDKGVIKFEIDDTTIFKSIVGSLD